MHRTLIVAKLSTDDPERIADVFAQSDGTELPRMIGVSRRTLFSFHDLRISTRPAATRCTTTSTPG